VSVGVDDDSVVRRPITLFGWWMAIILAILKPLHLDISLQNFSWHRKYLPTRAINHKPLVPQFPHQAHKYLRRISTPKPAPPTSITKPKTRHARRNDVKAR